MTECELYQGARDRKGYGRRRYRGRTIGAHRARFHEVFGWWPPVVRHTCDNPQCVNIWHLLPGTHADNTRDMMERGRHKYTLPPSGSGGRPRRSGMPSYASHPLEYMRERRARIRAGTW